MIYLASDHRGYELKERIKSWLKEWGYDFEDMGPEAFNEEDDYPDFISKAAQKVSDNPQSNKAIILGYSGQGEAIVANKYKGVRAAVYYGGPEDIIRLSRKHNDANVLSLGASFIDDNIAKDMVKLWLSERFSREARHIRRINKIAKIEE